MKCNQFYSVYSTKLTTTADFLSTRKYKSVLIAEGLTVQHKLFHAARPPKVATTEIHDLRTNSK